MEIKNPIIIYVFILVFLVLMLIKIPRTKKNNVRVANTKLFTKSKRYKEILRRHTILIYLLYGVIFVSLILSSVLSARIVSKDSSSKTIYNRDVMLCMDVSLSVLGLDRELASNYKTVVDTLRGERFGISIFNTSSYLLVPLTEDYEYVKSNLQDLIDVIDIYNFKKFGSTLYAESYILSGTIVGNMERGSSLTGDALASCIYDFSNLEDDRTKIIIFSTDNEVLGEEYINIEEAAKIAKKNKVKVYVFGNSNTTYENEQTLKKVANITGGQYYRDDGKNGVKEVINSIEKEKKSALVTNTSSFLVDYPEIPFVILFITFTAYVFLDKKVSE